MTTRDDQQLPLFELDLSLGSQTLKKVMPSFQPPHVEISESPYSKYIVYVDESGDHGMQTIDEKYPLLYWLCVYFISVTIVSK